MQGRRIGVGREHGVHRVRDLVDAGAKWVFGVINLLNTFKVRADWSAGFLLQQLAAQRMALDGVTALVRATSPACAPLLPSELPRAITVLQSLQDRL